MLSISVLLDAWYGFWSLRTHILLHPKWQFTQKINSVCVCWLTLWTFSAPDYGFGLEYAERSLLFLFAPLIIDQSILFAIDILSITTVFPAPLLIKCKLKHVLIFKVKKNSLIKKWRTSQFMSKNFETFYSIGKMLKACAYSSKSYVYWVL